MTAIRRAVLQLQTTVRIYRDALHGKRVQEAAEQLKQKHPEAIKWHKELIEIAKVRDKLNTQEKELTQKLRALDLTVDHYAPKPALTLYNDDKVHAGIFAEFNQYARLLDEYDLEIEPLKTPKERKAWYTQKLQELKAKYPDMFEQETK